MMSVSTWRSGNSSSDRLGTRMAAVWCACDRRLLVDTSCGSSFVDTSCGPSASRCHERIREKTCGVRVGDDATPRVFMR